LPQALTPSELKARRLSRERYLRPTSECDCHAPGILALADELAYDCRSDWDYTQKIYDFVRNEILMTIAAPPPVDGVVGTLQRGFGICIDKVNLLIALARAGDVPARYCFIGSSVLGEGAVPNPFFAALAFGEDRYRARLDRLRETRTDADGTIRRRPHPQAELQLDGVWVPADPTLGDDEAAGIGLPLPRLGYDPLMLWGATGNVIGRSEEMPNERQQRLARRFACAGLCSDNTCANQLLEQLREHGRQILAEEGEPRYTRRMNRFYVPLPGIR
jgi:hypothetical protein